MEAESVYSMQIEYNPYKKKLVEDKLTALIALFQYTGFANGDIDQTILVESLQDPGHKLTRAILFIYSLETFIPHSITMATRDKDITKVDTLGPYAVALRSIIIGSEIDKESCSDTSKDYETILWRPAMMNQSDIYDY